MVTVAQKGDHKRPEGHCSRCRKVWTQDTGQGICQWCGKLATCQTTAKSRHVKSRPRKPKRQDSGIGNGYDQLTEPYSTYYNVALPFAKGVPAQDGEDLLHTIIANLADTERSNEHRPDNPSWMYRIASLTKAQYWRNHYQHTNGLDCGRCNSKQRRKCKEDWLYGECPKAIKIESLHKPIIDSEGNLTELGELIVDPESLDPDIWERDSLWQIGYKPRLVAIALKLHRGDKLDWGDYKYLERYRQAKQKKLF